MFANGADPIASGLVTSLNRPGGNISGVTFLASETIPKRLEVLHELIPRAQVVGYLVNPVNPITEGEVKDTAAAARSRGLQLLVHSASAEGAIDEGFVTFMQRRVDALIIGNDTFLSSRKEQIFTRAAQHSIPTIYYEREFAVAGGLLSYGTDFADSYRQAGDYVARILKGMKPADLPVLQPTKYELVINLKTAKALGLDVPPALLARADEFIE